MATVYGVVGEYVVIDYIDDQPDYVLGPVVLTFSGSATGTVTSGVTHFGTATADLTITASSSAQVPRTIFGGSVEWDTPPTWATWTNNEWNGGIDSNIAFTSSSSGTVQKNGNSSANIVFTTSAEGGFLLNGTATSDLTLTSSASGDISKFGTATSNLTITATAIGDDFDFASATANIAFSGSATADLFVGGTATPSLTFSATGSAILVIRSVNADGNITLSATAEAGVVPGADPRRIFVVDSETRAFLILPDSRVTVVPSETRIQKIFEES